MSKVFRKITGTTPWVFAAVVLALALILYFAAQGTRYWQADRDNSSARDEIRLLERDTRNTPGGTTDQQVQLVTNLLRLEDLHLLFDYPATDTLLEIMSETARDTGIDLRSMNVGKATIEPVGTLQYRVQPVSISINGPTGNVQDFLAMLHDRVPVMAASNPSMSNLGTSESGPVTQLELRFYLSPEPIPEEDA